MTLVYTSDATAERCFYECGRLAETDDHVIPVEHGGANIKDNYVRACGQCNHRRGHKPIGQFMAELGLDKPVPTGLTSIEYKLRTFPLSQLTIIKCEWCERATIIVVQKAGGDKPRFCSRAHKNKWGKRKRPRIITEGTL